MAFILLNLKDCRKCPHCGSKLTKGYGYAMDYFCLEYGDKISSGYVEWESDVNTIPEWCPKLITNMNKKC